MKKNLVILFLVLLTIVNIAALATIAYHRFHPQRPFHPMGRPEIPETPEGFIKQELDLTEEQAEEFKAHFERFRMEMEPIHNSLEVKRAELMGEISADEPNKDKLDKLAEEIGTLQDTLQRKMISHLLEGKSLLTPEQQRKFFSLFREGGDRMKGLRDPKRMERRPGNPDFKNGR
jgi:Spy/CpxP family protein refolding chaperone